MVGVPKSTGCQICRRRKIKCDESWPHCVNCRKNGKVCPGPPSRHTFRDLGPRLNNNPNEPTLTSGGSLPSSRRPSPEGPSPPKCQSDDDKHLKQLNEKWSDNGAVFQKFRMSSREDQQLVRRARRSPHGSPHRFRISPSPSPSYYQALSRAFVDALSTGGVGHSMATFGPFMFEIPRRIGHNAALDAAAACLVHAHSALVQRKPATEVAPPRLYLPAVQALQTSLENPREGMSSNTLCASVILGLVEAMAGPRLGNRYLIHVGGAGRLMELQGPAKYQDPFAKEILRFNRGGIIITSIYERKPCFLTNPQWEDIAFDRSGPGPDDAVFSDLLRRMADFPSLLRELKDLRTVAIQPGNNIMDPSFNFSNQTAHPYDRCFDESQPNLGYTEDCFSSTYSRSPYSMDDTSAYTSSRNSLLQKVWDLKSALRDICGHMNAKLSDGSAAVEVPSTEPGNPFPSSYRFTNWRLAVAYNCAWSMCILTNKVMMKLLGPSDSNQYYLEHECRAVAHQICKTWEDAWSSRPIGAFHTGLSFVLAYEWCTPEVKAWIVNGLNALLEEQMVECFRWTDEIIIAMSGRLAGEGPDLEFKHRKASDT